MPTTISARTGPTHLYHHIISSIRQHGTEYMCTLCAPTRKRCLKYHCFPLYCYLGHIAVASPLPVSAKCCHPILATRFYSSCPRATRSTMSAPPDRASSNLLRMYGNVDLAAQPEPPKPLPGGRGAGELQVSVRLLTPVNQSIRMCWVVAEDLDQPECPEH